MNYIADRKKHMIKFRPRFELHTGFGVIEGEYEELIATKEKFPDYQLYELIPSALNMVRVSHYTSLSYEDYFNIHRLFKNGKRILDLEAQFKISHKTIWRILNDEFKILC